MDFWDFSTVYSPVLWVMVLFYHPLDGAVFPFVLRVHGFCGRQNRKRATFSTGQETQRPQQRRIFAYSEHRLQTTDATGGRDATAGRMLRAAGTSCWRRRLLGRMLTGSRSMRR